MYKYSEPRGYEVDEEGLPNPKDYRFYLKSLLAERMGIAGRMAGEGGTQKMEEKILAKYPQLIEAAKLLAQKHGAA